MDILKRIAANREKSGMDKKAEEAAPMMTPAIQIHKKPTLNQLKMEIINEKPKVAKVKEYFERLIEECAEDSDNEEVSAINK